MTAPQIFFIDVGKVPPKKAKKFLKRAKRALKTRGSLRMIENPQIGDEVILHGFSEEGERARIVDIEIDGAGGQENLCVELHDDDTGRMSTRQWVSVWEVERVDAVTRLGEVGDDD